MALPKKRPSEAGAREAQAEKCCLNAVARAAGIRDRMPPRRFDARFFIADAAAIWDDVDDFCAAEDELSHLHWAPLTEVRKLNLPFITRVVLAELQAHLPSTSAPDRVPFIRNDAIDSEVIWL